MAISSRVYECRWRWDVQYNGCRLDAQWHEPVARPGGGRREWRRAAVGRGLGSRADKCLLGIGDIRSRSSTGRVDRWVWAQARSRRICHCHVIGRRRRAGGVYDKSGTSPGGELR